MQLSIEQRTIIDNLKTESNVTSDSVAGGGKSTVAIHIAKEFSQSKILLLTYNAKLKVETREKVIKYKIENMEVHSYHSFCVKYYNHTAFTDEKMKVIIINQLPPLVKFVYDIIILDESQDINPLYYKIIKKLYTDAGNQNAKICIIGDKYQSIYDFNGADPRFLIYSDKCFNFNVFPWVKCTLSESFRITDKMAEFINKCMLNFNRIKATKRGTLPSYFICDTFEDDNSIPFDQIKTLLKTYEPNDIFVLAPSIKNSKCPVRKLENKIKSELANIHVYVPTSDEEKIDNSIINGKLVFSTFHQAKGMERKVVLVFGFDNSHFKFYKKDSNILKCPNELYVATTRALEKLLMFHQYTEDYLPFLNQHQLKQCTNFNMIEKLRPRKYKHAQLEQINTSPTDLCRHLSQDIVDQCMTYFTVTTIKTKMNKVKLPTKTKQKNTDETVSEINGTAIPIYYEYLLTKKINIINRLPENETITEYNDLPLFDAHTFEPEEQKYSISQIKQNFKKGIIKIDELLYVVNRWNSFKNGYLFKVKQIQEYDWLTNDMMNECVENLKTLNISKNASFEHLVEIGNKDELLNRKLTGYIDAIDENKIYEFKCVKKLTNVHYLQLAIYAYMYEQDDTQIKPFDTVMYNNGQQGIVMQIYKNGNVNVKNKMTHKVEKLTLDQLIPMNKKSNSYYIYNILSGKLKELTFKQSALKQMMKYLIESKYGLKRIMSDEEFFQTLSL